MADDTAKPNGTPEPPKIRITPPAGRPPTSSNQEPPPKIRIKPGEPGKKAETAKLDTSSAHAQTAPADDIEPMTREATGDFYKRSTIRIDQAPPKASDTQKIKSDTHRVDQDAAKRSTMRVDVDPETTKRKSETSRLELPQGEAAKRATAKIGNASDIAEALKKNVPTGIPAAPPPGLAQRPKTVTVRPPGAPAPAAAPSGSEPMIAPAPEAVSEARKSETARIDLPPEVSDAERPATRPKTIRIKRPDGTTAKKALTIARPSEDQMYSPISAEVSGGDLEGDEPGTMYSVMALVSVIVCVVLLYVLAAQTIAPTLPFPGRI